MKHKLGRSTATRQTAGWTEFVAPTLSAPQIKRQKLLSELFYKSGYYSIGRFGQFLQARSINKLTDKHKLFPGGCMK